MHEWRIAGSYYETCNCEAVCPCRRLNGHPGGRSTLGICCGLLSWSIKEGRFDLALTAYENVLALDPLNQHAKQGRVAADEARRRLRATRTVSLDRVPHLARPDHRISQRHSVQKPGASGDNVHCRGIIRADFGLDDATCGWKYLIGRNCGADQQIDV